MSRAAIGRGAGSRALRGSAVALAILVFGPAAALTEAPDFTMAWARKWTDTHFSPGLGSLDGYGIAIDSSGTLYLSGTTREHGTALNYGFVAAFDADLNELWYRRDYIPATSQPTGVHRVACSPDGTLIAHATVEDSGVTCTRVMSLSPTDGSVIWQTDLPRPNAWARIWDGAAGPVVDAAGNIFVVTGLGLDKTTNNGEPMGIYKLDPDGNLLWAVEDSLASYCSVARGWDDVWDVALDSHGSLYISATANMDLSNGTLNYGLVKYSTDGERQWMRWKEWGSKFDAPRGIAISAEDFIYQSGNVRLLPEEWPGIRKFDTDGNLLAEAQVEQDVKYPYGTVTDAQGNLILHGIEYGTNASEFCLYSPDLEQLARFEYTFPGCISYDMPTRGVLDPWGNAYLLQYFADSENGGAHTIGVVKIGNQGPQDVPEPAQLWLFASGLIGLVAVGLRSACAGAQTGST